MNPIEHYLQLLHPTIPDFLIPYLNCPSLQRLKGIGLFCGVDYSCLFHPDLFYSRYDHSLGVALIIYHFTKNKKATLAGLFHDISTPVFSHAIDFKNKDYLNQEYTEKDNVKMILEDKMLISQLELDGINVNDILHDDTYPIANKKTPCICADRLEYMYSTGLFLTHGFDEMLIKESYENLIYTDGELRFTSQKLATAFFYGCLENTKLFLEPYDKITLQLLGDIVDRALEVSYIHPKDLYAYSELELLTLLETKSDSRLMELLLLLKKQTNVITSNHPLPDSYHYIINVKRRYIDPLVYHQRLSDIDSSVKQVIEALFIDDNRYICLAYVH